MMNQWIQSFPTNPNIGKMRINQWSQGFQTNTDVAMLRYLSKHTHTQETGMSIQHDAWKINQCFACAQLFAHPVAKSEAQNSIIIIIIIIIISSIIIIIIILIIIIIIRRISQTSLKPKRSHRRRGKEWQNQGPGMLLLRDIVCASHPRLNKVSWKSWKGGGRTDLLYSFIRRYQAHQRSSICQSVRLTVRAGKKVDSCRLQGGDDSSQTASFFLVFPMVTWQHDNLPATKIQ